MNNIDSKLAAVIIEFADFFGAIKITPGGLMLTIIKAEGEDFLVKKNKSTLLIKYTRRVEIFVGLIKAAAADTEFEYHARARLDNLSLMADNSRNAVFNVHTAKRLVRLLAGLGYNQLQLYTEDTLTIENQPYFGHMRGKFTSEEIREIDSYAANFGIELVPCIQTLAHLNAIFKWEAYKKINDCEDILLVREDGTYKLLDDIIGSCARMFRSRKINIGMDEAFLTGAGKFLERHGYVKRTEIIKEHLAKVVRICKKYDFAPMMWSDMFFRPDNNGEYTLETSNPYEVPDITVAAVPDEVALVYWDYYRRDPKVYMKMFERHYKFGKELYFAGGAWRWSGFAPFNMDGMVKARAACEALKESRIKNVMVTVWGDNGSECSVFAVLPQIALYSAYNYSNDLSDIAVTQIMKSVDANYKDFLDLDLPNFIYGKEWRQSNASKCFLYNDPLLGMADYYAKEEYAEMYQGYADRLREAGIRNQKYKYVFEVLSKLCAALEIKCTLGIRLKAAYENEDREALARIAKQDIPECIKRVKVFEKAFELMWNTDNKTVGREITDIRLAGVIARLNAAARAVKGYLAGKTDKIEELEQPRLPIDPNDGGVLYRHRYDEIASASIFTRHM